MKLFWLVTDGYEDGSAKEMRKWIYELYSTFLADGAVSIRFVSKYAPPAPKHFSSALHCCTFCASYFIALFFTLAAEIRGRINDRGNKENW
jgi:hypothetical protein